MGIFSFVESAMKNIVEGSARRLFPTQLQEQEALDALRDVMVDHVTNENGRLIAPHRYLIKMNPADYDNLRAKYPALDERMALDLKQIANDQGYLLKAALRVTLDRDPRVPAGRAVAQVIGDADPALAPVGANISSDATQTMQAGALAAPAPAPGPADPSIQIPPAWLTLIQPSRGQPMRLDRPVIKIGRHNTNDIIVNEKRVSRFHAEVRYEHNQFILTDLHSVNGVQVNGARMTRPVPLQDRDIVGVCGYEFIFQRR